MARRRGARGQSTLEYVLVVAAVLAGIIAIVTIAMPPAIKATVQESADTVTGAAGNLSTGLRLP